MNIELLFAALVAGPAICYVHYMVTNKDQGERKHEDPEERKEQPSKLKIEDFQHV
jgi:hypothetical protein